MRHAQSYSPVPRVGIVIGLHTAAKQFNVLTQDRASRVLRERAGAMRSEHESPIARMGTWVVVRSAAVSRPQSVLTQLRIQPLRTSLNNCTAFRKLSLRLAETIHASASSPHSEMFQSSSTRLAAQAVSGAK